MALSKNNKFRVFGSKSKKLTDTQYDQLPDRDTGNKEGGIASSSLNNTALNQVSLLAVSIAEFLAKKIPMQQIDSSLSVEQLAVYIEQAIQGMIPTKVSQLQNDVGYNKVQIFSGTGEPSPSLGKDGDLYVRFEK